MSGEPQKEKEVFLVSSCLAWIALVASRLPLYGLVVADADPAAQNIRAFFTNLADDVMFFALSMAVFFFMLAALCYMVAGATGNERMRQQAIGALYAVLGALAFALLAFTAATLVKNAVPA